MKVLSPVLWGAAAFWVIIFALARFAPGEAELLLRYAGWSKYSAVSLPANYAREMPFPIPTAILSLITWNMPTGLVMFRLPNLIIGLAGLTVLSALAPAGFTIFAATSLWMVWTVMTDLPTGLVILLSGAVLLVDLRYRHETKKLIWLGFLNLWLSMTSWSGWVFTLVFAGYKLKSGNWKLIGMLLAILAWGGLTAGREYLTQPDFESTLTVSQNPGGRVDQRVRYETKFNDYQEPVPLAMKRLVYNKPYFVYREIMQKIGGIFSWEKWAFPGQGDATVTRSLWGSKSLPWIYFWQIPLVIFSLTRWKKYDKDLKVVTGIFGIWGVAGMILGKTNDWLINGVGLVVASLLTISWLIARMNYWQKWVVALLLVVTSGPSVYHFIFHKEIWRDNRPEVHVTMARVAIKYQAGQVTTVLGRSFLYYGWLNKISPGEFWQGVEAGMKIRGVKFDHFVKPEKAGVYVGLPGEFLGSRATNDNNEFVAGELPQNWQLLEREKIKDTVSFGNGDYVWTVLVKK